MIVLFNVWPCVNWTLIANRIEVHKQIPKGYNVHVDTNIYIYFEN